MNERPATNTAGRAIDELGPIHDLRALPIAALDDFGEYRRRGGRFGIEVWWRRYRDDYVGR